jgi:hypothetical protein
VTIVRLSDWRGRTPHRDAMTSKVMMAIEPMLATMGAEADPTCWVVWGDDPGVRYVIFVPTDPGLLQVHVRVNVPQEGPRSSAKLIRWNRVQVGELNIEVAGGHRLLSFQVEGQVLKGSDEDADAIAAFARDLFAAIDGRHIIVAPTAHVANGSAPGAAIAADAPVAASSGAPPAPDPAGPLQLPPPSEA